MLLKKNQIKKLFLLLTFPVFISISLSLYFLSFLILPLIFLVTGPLILIHSLFKIRFNTNQADMNLILFSRIDKRVSNLESLADTNYSNLRNRSYIKRYKFLAEPEYTIYSALQESRSLESMSIMNNGEYGHK